PQCSAAAASQPLHSGRWNQAIAISKPNQSLRSLEEGVLCSVRQPDLPTLPASRKHWSVTRCAHPAVPSLPAPLRVAAAGRSPDQSRAGVLPRRPQSPALVLADSINPWPHRSILALIASICPSDEISPDRFLLCRHHAPAGVRRQAGASTQERKVAMVHFKNRYMVMEVFIDVGRGEQDPLILTQFNITKAIRDSIQLNFGECGLAASLGSLQVKYVNPVTKLCIIRVSREDHQKVWAAITMVRCIGKIPVSFNLLDVSGSIRGCKKAALECDEAKFEQYKLAAGDRITPEIIQSVQSCYDKIRGLES
ncbi:LOW QUALITY PROTEIN: hypothetical protein U9M48_011004, partial [Paspalum notatum var. saurae]